MRILVNTTNIRIGGGVQKAVEFVRATRAYDRGHVFAYALSDVVANNLRGVTDLAGQEALVAGVSPARPLARRATVRGLRDLERRFRPDVVYSVFGPTYVSFGAPHLMGFAVPWVTHPNRYAWDALRSPLTRAWYWAWIQRAVHSTRSATRWVLETEVAAGGLARVLGVERGRCHVIPNSPAEHYYRAAGRAWEPFGPMRKERSDDFNLLVFSAWYPHKNLELVPRVAAETRKRDPSRSYRFFLTFDRSSPAWTRIQRDAARLGVADRVANLGTIPIADGPRLYGSADALFLPTLLESFTATYPEAMCMGRPIVTTDLDFAREICGDAGLFFPPGDATAAAEAVVRTASDESLRHDLVRRGQERLAGSKTPEQIYGMVLDLLEFTARG
jgi:glycosyltransferase involved in cell wall biosynthesis